MCGNTVFYSLYGLITSQLGDVEEEHMTNAFTGESVSVANFVETYFGYHHGFVGWCVLILGAFNLLFRVVIAVSMKYLNWQKR